MHIESTCTKGDANSLSCSPFSHSVSGFPSHERPWSPKECSSTFVLYVWSQNDGHSPRMLCIPCPCSPWVITSHSCKPALTVHFPWSLTASLLLPPHILCTDAMYILHSWDAVQGKNSLPFPVFFLYSHAAMGFPGGSDVKESACSAGDLSSFPGLGRSGEGKGYPLQYSGLEDSMDCRVQGVVKSRTQLSNFHSPRFRCQS